MRWLLCPVLLVLLTTPLTACPMCDTDTGRQVRTELFNEDFGYHLFLTAFPFPIVFGLIALAHYGWPLVAARTPDDGEAL